MSPIVVKLMTALLLRRNNKLINTLNMFPYKQEYCDIGLLISTKSSGNFALKFPLECSARGSM
jgi:hypothetical protein